MKKLLLLFTICTVSLVAKADVNFWQQVTSKNELQEFVRSIQPNKYLVYQLQEQNLRPMLANLSEDPDRGLRIELPTPDGTFRMFKVWQAPMMEAVMAAQFPEIKTFTAIAIDNSAVTAKLDFTDFGFHAMIFDGDKTYLIDPYNNSNSGYYFCYYKKDIVRKSSISCEIDANAGDNPAGSVPGYLTANGLPEAQLKVNGALKHTYRLALACTGEYSVAVADPAPASVARSLSAMTTSMNRVNGVYEKEIGVHLNFITNETALIYTDPATDPFTANNNGPALRYQNQVNTDTTVGVAAYDLGHIFSTGGGGIAELASVCDALSKAQAVTGQPDPVGDAFDIDFVVHEMGHQFGATHTFNAATGSCNGNTVILTAFEPGSGSTIMAYAGICGAGDNLQLHSDDYFHAASLAQMSDFILSPTDGGACAVTTTSGNNPSIIPSFTQTFTIPYLTPFEIDAPLASDADKDSPTYNWEEYDLADFNKSFSATTIGPIFRSFKPTSSVTKTFPRLDSLLHNNTNYLGEKLPEVTRKIAFKLTVRDVHNGWGCFNTPDDSLVVKAVSSAGPFRVSFPNAASDNLQSGSTTIITWDVAHSDQAPVNCSNVNILLSTDGGYHYNDTLATNTANDGNETITIPKGIAADKCRVKIKAVGSVFFDISDYDFKITSLPAGGVKIYPVPANNILKVETGNSAVYEIRICNILGQRVYESTFAGRALIDVRGWAYGVYSIRLINKDTSERIDKKITVL